MKSKKFAHTVNIAAAPIVTVFDDQGNIIQSFMLPICLLIFLPCRLYTAWLNLTHHASRITSYAAGWHNDLVLITWAARLLIRQGRFAYAC